MTGIAKIDFSQQYHIKGEYISSKKISTIVCLLRIYQGDVNNVNIQCNVTLEITDNFSYHLCCLSLAIDIIVCEDQYGAPEFTLGC